MPQVQAILFDPIVQMAVAVLIFATVLAVTRTPKDKISRKRVLYGLWILCFAGLAQWTMWLEREVLIAGHLPSTHDTTAVAIKGTVRYVPLDLAYRHDGSWLVLVVCMLAFMLILRVGQASDEA